MNVETQYLDLLEYVMKCGQDKGNRTGVKTRMTHGAVLRHNADLGFPLLTSKKVNFQAIAAELCWFLSGDTDCATLDELNPGGSNIWKANAKAWQEGPNGNKHMPETYCGYLYGMLWREFGVCNGGEFERSAKNDQIANVVRLICDDPQSRRILISNWDAAAHNDGAGDQLSCLPPCHLLCQFNIDEDEMRMDTSVYMRSADLFLGVPFNLASYALLAEIISYIVFCQSGKRYKPRMLVMFLNDAHIYHNHFEQVRTQLSRKNDLYKFPNLDIRPNIVLSVESLGNPEFVMSALSLGDYKHHPYLRAEMAV